MEFKEMEHDFTPVGIACICNDCEELFIIPFDEIEDECDCEEFYDDELIEDLVEEYILEEIITIKGLMECARENNEIEQYLELLHAFERLVNM